MGTTAPDTATIEHDIDRSRAQLGAAMYALGDRIAPKKVIFRMREKARLAVATKVEDVKERLSPRRALRRVLPGRPALPAGRRMAELPPAGR